MDSFRGRGARGKAARFMRIRGVRGRAKIFRGMHPKKGDLSFHEKAKLARREYEAKYRSHRRSYSRERSPRRSYSRSRSRSRGRSISPRSRSRRRTRSRSRTPSPHHYRHSSKYHRSPSWDRSPVPSRSYRSGIPESAKNPASISKPSPQPAEEVKVKQEAPLNEVSASPKEVNKSDMPQWKSGITIQLKDHVDLPTVSKNISLYEDPDVKPAIKENPPKDVSVREPSTTNLGLLNASKQTRLQPQIKEEFDIFADDQPSKPSFKEYLSDADTRKPAKSAFPIPALDFDNIEDEEEFLYGEREETGRTVSSLRAKSPVKLQEKSERQTSGWSDDENDFVGRSSSRPAMYHARTPSPIEREIRRIESKPKDYSLDDLRHLLDREDMSIKEKVVGRDSSSVVRGSSYGSLPEREELKMHEKGREAWESPVRSLERKRIDSPISYPSRNDVANKFRPSPESPFSKKLSNEKGMWSPLCDDHLKPRSAVDNYRKSELPASRLYEPKLSPSPNMPPSSSSSRYRFNDESRSWRERSIPHQSGHSMSPLRTCSPDRRRSTSSSPNRYPSPYRGRSPQKWQRSPPSRGSDYRMRRSTSPPPRQYRTESPSRDYMDRARLSPDRPPKVNKRRSRDRSWSPRSRGSDYSASPPRHTDRDPYRRKRSISPEPYRSRERSPSRYSPRRSQSPRGSRWRELGNDNMDRHPDASYRQSNTSYYSAPSDKPDSLLTAQQPSLPLVSPDASVMQPSYPYGSYPGNFNPSIPPPPNFHALAYPPPFPPFSMPPQVPYTPAPTAQPPMQDRTNLKVIPLQSSSSEKPANNTIITLSNSAPGVDKTETTSIVKSPLTSMATQSSKTGGRNVASTESKSSKPLGLTEFLKIRNKQKCELRALEEELLRVNKMQGELMRKKQREKDGHRDPIIIENSKLQEDIKKQIADLAKRMEDTKKSFFSSQSSSISVPATAILENKEEEEEEEKVEKSKVEEQDDKKEMAEEKDEAYEMASVWFNYFDPGNHWCKSCNEFLPNIFKLFEHLHTDEHKQKMDPCVRPWKKLTRQKLPSKPPNSHSCPAPLKGAQFLEPLTGFFCSICECFMGDIVDAEDHLKSPSHNRNYTKYSLLNPFYERRWNLDRAAGLAVVEKRERKKRKEEEREREYKRRRREEEAEKMQKELLALEREHSKPVKELDEDNASDSKSKIASGNKQDSSKARGIKLTLLGEKKKMDNDNDKGKDAKATQIVYIGKAPCFKSTLKQEKVKQPGFGKFSWKKKDEKDDKKSDCAEANQDPEQEEWMTMFTDKASMSPSETQSFQLRKGTPKSKSDQGDSTPSDEKRVSAKDIATAFAGKLNAKETAGENTETSSPQQELQGPKICSSTYMEAVKKAESMKGGTTAGDTSTGEGGNQSIYASPPVAGTPPQDVPPHSGPLLPEPPMTHPGPLLPPPTQSTPLLQHPPPNPSGPLLPQPPPAFQNVPPPPMQPHFQGYPQQYQGFPPMQQPYQGYPPGPFHGYPQMQQPYQEFNNYQQGYQDYSQYQQYPPNYQGQPYPQQGFQGYPPPPMGQQYGPSGPPPFPGQFYPPDQPPPDCNRHPKQPLMKTPKNVPGKKVLKPINPSKPAPTQIKKPEGQQKASDASTDAPNDGKEKDVKGDSASKGTIVGDDKDPAATLSATTNAKADDLTSSETKTILPLTDEEKDLKLLGIDKTDLKPLCTPKVPPSIAATSDDVALDAPPSTAEIHSHSSCDVVDMDIEDSQGADESERQDETVETVPTQELKLSTIEDQLLLANPENMTENPQKQIHKIVNSESTTSNLMTQDSLSKNNNQHKLTSSKNNGNTLSDGFDNLAVDKTDKNDEEEKAPPMTTATHSEQGHDVREDKSDAIVCSERDSYANVYSDDNSMTDASNAGDKMSVLSKKHARNEAVDLRISGFIREPSEQSALLDANADAESTPNDIAPPAVEEKKPTPSTPGAVDLRVEMGPSSMSNDENRTKVGAVGTPVDERTGKIDDGLYHIPPGTGQEHNPALDLTTDIITSTDSAPNKPDAVQKSPNKEPSIDAKKWMDTNTDGRLPDNAHSDSKRPPKPNSDGHGHAMDLSMVTEGPASNGRDQKIEAFKVEVKTGEESLNEERLNFTNAIRDLQMLEAAASPQTGTPQFASQPVGSETGTASEPVGEKPSESANHTSNSHSFVETSISSICDAPRPTEKTSVNSPKNDRNPSEERETESMPLQPPLSFEVLTENSNGSNTAPGPGCLELPSEADNS